MLRFSVALVILLSAALTPAQNFASPAATWPTEAAEAAGYPYDVAYGGYPPGGYERRIGKPYYWSIPGSTVPLAGFGGQPAGDAIGYAADYGAAGLPRSGGCNCNKASYGVVVPGGLAPIPDSAPAGFGTAAASGAGPRAASPDADPYTHHFGPGFYRSSEFGHYRFPYYSYRRPWYDVGHPVRVRDTNLPW